MRQLELEGKRLRYVLVSGEGPTSGWVSLSAAGKDLMLRRGRKVFWQGRWQDRETRAGSV